MDTLVTIGTTAAYVGGYFDTGAIIIGLILLGRYLEAKAKAGTSEAIKKLIGLQAKTARVTGSYWRCDSGSPRRKNSRGRNNYWGRVFG